MTWLPQSLPSTLLPALVGCKFPGSHQEGLKRITYSSHCWKLWVKYGLYNDRSITLEARSADRLGEGIFLTDFIAKSMVFIVWIFVSSLTERGGHFPGSTLV